MKEKLLHAARAVMPHAYVKYSNFPVAAALALKDGRIVTGVNIENASFGLTNCAERTALYKAYSEGVQKEDIVAILVTTPKPFLVSPCGACRQVMRELIPEDADVYLVDAQDNVTQLKNIDLLPYGFTEEDL